MTRVCGSMVLSLGLAVVLTALTGAVGGCGEREGAAQRQAGRDQEAVVHAYEVRGRITELPGDRPGQELMIHHEAIDDFRDSAGDIAPMPAMIMPFPPAPEVSLESFEVGDVVQATLEVQWQPEAGWRMTAIEKLPEDTELDLGTAGHDHNHDHDHHDH